MYLLLELFMTKVIGALSFRRSQLGDLLSGLYVS